MLLHNAAMFSDIAGSNTIASMRAWIAQRVRAARYQHRAKPARRDTAHLHGAAYAARDTYLLHYSGMGGFHALATHLPHTHPLPPPAPPHTHTAPTAPALPDYTHHHHRTTHTTTCALHAPLHTTPRTRTPYLDTHCTHRTTLPHRPPPTTPHPRTSTTCYLPTAAYTTTIATAPLAARGCISRIFSSPPLIPLLRHSGAVRSGHNSSRTALSVCSFHAHLNG